MRKIYLTPEIAVAEFHRRRHQTDLLQEVEAYWASNGWPRPPLPSVNGTPLGLIARCVATFRYEEAAFLAMCQRAGILPTWLEFTGDTFVSTTRTKLMLLQVHTCSGVGRKGGPKIKKEQFVSANIANGRPINTVTNGKGERLVDYHHALLRQRFPEAICEDMTTWLRATGGRARGFYEALLSVFVAHGIQFEDYTSDSTSHEARFREDVFEPAWRATVARFGVAPMVVELPYLGGFEYMYPADDDWRHHGILPPEYGGEIPARDFEPDGALRLVKEWNRAGSAVTIEQFLAARGDGCLRSRVNTLLRELDNDSITIEQFLDSRGDHKLHERVVALERRMAMMSAAP
jgi:hypothetical protein